MYKLFNSITNQDYKIWDGDELNWYCCGPTIYNDSHLGHARTYIIFDSIKKYLKSQNCSITYGMNITDIDDKIVKKVHDKYNNLNNLEKEKNNVQDIYSKFIKDQENSFWNDMESLNIEKPDKIIRVSDVIPDIIKFIEKLIEDNYAYESNGSVYFSMDNYFKKYKTIMSNANDGDSCVKNNFLNDKKNQNDFALWKGEKKTDISWDSPWGYGRPGWHIECSVMMDKMFGKKIDIHSGGIDLKFPHHHNEYIQTTAFYGQENLIKCFVHSGHLHIDNEKMSQSLGNFITIKEFLKKYDANTLRILFLMSNWRETFNLNEENIKNAKSICDNIFNFMINLDYYEKVLKDYKKEIYDRKYEEFQRRIYVSLDDNFKSYEVFKILSELFNQVNIDFNEKNLVLEQIHDVRYTMNLIINVFGLKFNFKNIKSDNILKHIESIISIRNDIRDIAKIEKDKETKKKLFLITDKIRDKILPDLGIRLEDTNGIDKWSFI